APGRGGYEPPVVLPAAVGGRCVGLALFYPALAALGLVEAARECFSLKAAERFGVRAVSLSLFFLYALGGSTIEGGQAPHQGIARGAGRGGAGAVRQDPAPQAGRAGPPAQGRAVPGAPLPDLR
ncbi:MAG: hypothetical protein WA938_09685, partial [Candidatus Dormiibacterota bacterium]